MVMVSHSHTPDTVSEITQEKVMYIIFERVLVSFALPLIGQLLVWEPMEECVSISW